MIIKIALSYLINTVIYLKYNLFERSYTMSLRIDSRKYFPVKFHNASALMGLNSGIAELDKLLGFIPKGNVVFIKGSRSRKHILELFCLRSITQYHNYCVFIDGGNSFDPYLLSKLVRKEKPKEVLSRIIISRAFTCHQLASLLMKETEKTVQRYPTDLIAVSDILHLFTDPESRSDIDEYEIEMILPMMLKSIKKLSSNATVAITSDASNEWLSRMVESYSDIVLAVNYGKERVGVILEKHPSYRKASAELTLHDKPYTVERETIEPWLMVNG